MWQSFLKVCGQSCLDDVAKVVPTVLPSGTVWDASHRRLHLGVEQLCLQGIQFSGRTMSSLSNSQCQDLAGNALLG